MTYSIKLSSKASKFLKKQDKQIYSRLKNSLKKLELDPFSYVEHFEGGDFYKFRVGDYRALVEIDKKRKIVWVRVLDKRARIYKGK